jgi:hypothetical protein
LLVVAQFEIMLASTGVRLSSRRSLSKLLRSEESAA